MRFYVVAVPHHGICLVSAKTSPKRLRWAGIDCGSAAQLAEKGWTSVGAQSTREPLVPMIDGIVADGYTRATLRGHVGHVRRNVFWLRARSHGTIRITGPGLPTLEIPLP